MLVIFQRPHKFTYMHIKYFIIRCSVYSFISAVLENFALNENIPRI